MILLTPEEITAIVMHTTSFEEDYDKLCKAQLAKVVEWLEIHNITDVWAFRGTMVEGTLTLNSRDWKEVRESVK
jgi:hypothetical protein